MQTRNRLGQVTESGSEMAVATLKSGPKMPLVAFGTLMESLQPDYKKTVDIIESAVDVGYRHFDTAQIYNTETMLGEALRNKMAAGKATREQFYVTTKLWRNCHKEKDVVPSLNASLRRLGLDYVDLFLIHWPTAFVSGEEKFPKENGKLLYDSVDYLETWKGMEECVRQGLTKSIGLSNFNSKQIQRLLDNCEVRPTVLQVETHPYLTNTKLVDFCRDRDIVVVAYSPLFGFNQSFRDSQGWPVLHEDPVIKAVADRHRCTPAQVALAYQLRRGVGVAPKTSRVTRMEENFASQLVELSEDEMQTLNACNRNLRLNAEFPDHPDYPFHEEF